MSDPRKPVFEAIKAARGGDVFAPMEVAQVDDLLDRLKVPRAVATPAATVPTSADGLTARIAIELIAHEGIVPEAYRDSRGIWTWSVGLARTGGWPVLQYKDKPASLKVCLAAYLDALRKNYLPAVRAAFPGVLAEHELGALLSFHYNTGAIARLKPNAMDFMQWRRPPEVVPRRSRERELFLHGTWTGDGTVLVYDVAKPSYHPVRPKRMQVGAIIAELLA